MNTKRVLSAAAGAALAAMAAAAPGFAQSPPDGVAQIDILPGWKTDSGSRMAGIRIRLAPGWKTYWRSPGSGGIPPSLSWQDSENLAGSKLYWPVPEVYDLYGIRSLIYTDQVVIPLELFPKSEGEPEIRLRGEMELGICKDICLPATVSLQADLVGEGAPDALILQGLENQPVPASSANVGRVSCSVLPAEDGLKVSADIQVPRLGPDEYVLMELPDKAIWISDTDTWRNGDHLMAVADMVPPEAAPFPLNRSDLTITLFAGGKAVEISGCPEG